MLKTPANLLRYIKETEVVADSGLRKLFRLLESTYPDGLIAGARLKGNFEVKGGK
jgi:hypothetical protein